MAAKRSFSKLRVGLRSFVEQTTHVNYRIGSEPNRLFCDGWEDSWRLENRVYCGPILIHNGLLDEDQVKYLCAVCEQIVRFLVDGKNEHFEKNIASDLERAIGDYLSTRGCSVSKGRGPNKSLAELREQRDARCYELGLDAGNKWHEIQETLNSEYPSLPAWETNNGGNASKAARDYARRKALPSVPSRTRGRRKSGNSEK